MMLCRIDCLWPFPDSVLLGLLTIFEDGVWGVVQGPPWPFLGHFVIVLSWVSRNQTGKDEGICCASISQARPLWLLLLRGNSQLCGNSALAMVSARGGAEGPLQHLSKPILDSIGSLYEMRKWLGNIYSVGFTPKLTPRNGILRHPGAN